MVFPKLIKGLTAILGVCAISLLSLPAQASSWGCEVLLCLSNPAGPTAVSECEPPIEKLYDHLRDGGDFPSCTQADGSPIPGIEITKGRQRLRECPAGTTDTGRVRTNGDGHMSWQRTSRICRVNGSKTCRFGGHADGCEYRYVLPGVRSKPNWIRVNNNGVIGQPFWW